MGFGINEDKCKVMHVGYNNEPYNYKLQGKNLVKTKEEKDLGIIVRSDLKKSCTMFGCKS